MDQNPLSQLTAALEPAQSVLLLLPPQPDFDSTLAALALRDGLSSLSKLVNIGCSSPVADSYPDLPEVDSIKPSIGQQTLIVSFDYQEDAVENVSYDIDDATHKFNLRIQPRPNTPPLDASRVQFTYTGAAADLVITFGIRSLEELGQLYSDEKDFLDSANLFHLTQGAKSSLPGTSLGLTTGFSETILQYLRQNHLEPSPDIATSLYTQLLQSTHNFSSPAITPETFESAAFLLRHGARKLPTFPGKPLTPSPFVPGLPPRPTEPEAFPPTTPPVPTSAPGVPADWQGPKVYRGGSPLR